MDVRRLRRLFDAGRVVFAARPTGAGLAAVEILEIQDGCAFWYETPEDRAGCPRDRLRRRSRSCHVAVVRDMAGETWRASQFDVYESADVKLITRMRARTELREGDRVLWRHVSDDEVSRMRDLRAEGLSYSRIGKIMKRNVQTVYAHLEERRDKVG